MAGRLLTRACVLIFCIFSGSYSIAERIEPKAKDVVYAEVADRKLSLDLYMPPDKQNPYLIVWVHGGAWHSGSKESPPLGLLSAGYAIASVAYRLSVEARFPAMIHDIKAAIRFLRANAKKFGFRGDKIIIWGSSAGGHLAALVGTTNNDKELEGNLGDHLDQSSSVQAVVDFYGPTNFLTILSQSTSHGVSVRAPALALLLGSPVKMVPDLARKASPVYQVDASDPPLLIMHGDQDNQVPVNQSLELHGAYQQKELKVQLEIVHGAGHSDDTYFEPKNQRIIELFLSKALTN